MFFFLLSDVIGFLQLFFTSMIIIERKTKQKKEFQSRTSEQISKAMFCHVLFFDKK